MLRLHPNPRDLLFYSDARATTLSVAWVCSLLCAATVLCVLPGPQRTRCTVPGVRVPNGVECCTRASSLSRGHIPMISGFVFPLHQNLLFSCTTLQRQRLHVAHFSVQAGWCNIRGKLLQVSCFSAPPRLLCLQYHAGYPVFSTTQAIMVSAPRRLSGFALLVLFVQLYPPECGSQAPVFRPKHCLRAAQGGGKQRRAWRDPGLVRVQVDHGAVPGPGGDAGGLHLRTLRAVRALQQGAFSQPSSTTRTVSQSLARTVSRRTLPRG